MITRPWAAMPKTEKGSASFRAIVSMFRSAMPDIKLTIDDEVYAGDKVVHRWHLVGTDTGGVMGMPPSGKKLTFTRHHHRADARRQDRRAVGQRGRVGPAAAVGDRAAAAGTLKGETRRQVDKARDLPTCVLVCPAALEEVTSCQTTVLQQSSSAIRPASSRPGPTRSGAPPMRSAVTWMTWCTSCTAQTPACTASASTLRAAAAIKGVIELMLQRLADLGPVRVEQLIAGRDFIWQELAIDSPAGRIEPYEMKFLRDGQVYLQLYGFKRAACGSRAISRALHRRPARAAEQLHHRYIDYQARQDADGLADDFFTADARLVTARLNVEGREACARSFATSSRRKVAFTWSRSATSRATMTTCGSRPRRAAAWACAPCTM